MKPGSNRTKRVSVGAYSNRFGLSALRAGKISTLEVADAVCAAKRHVATLPIILKETQVDVVM